MEDKNLSFSFVEMSDWKKRDLFIRNKLELNWGMDTIFSKKNNTDLGEYEFKKVKDWLLSSAVAFKPEFVDLADDAGWQQLREISTSTNLLAKDALHFCIALAIARNGKCDFFITSDGNLITESNSYLKRNRLKKILQISKPKEFIKSYPPL